MLGRRLIDLDQEFLRRFGDIGEFIRQSGYQSYKVKNSALVKNTLLEAYDDILFVTSSGFLTEDNPVSAFNANDAVLSASYSVYLLPSRDIEDAVKIVVKRQLSRPFTSDRIREEQVIRERYLIYSGLGDLIVFLAAPPSDIAPAISAHLFLADWHPHV